MQYVWVILLFLPSALSQSNGRFRVVVPEAPVSSVSGSDVVLSCSVREDYNTNIMMNAVDLNVTWSRSDLKDSLVHLYGNHKDLNTGQNPFYRGRTAVFKEQLKNGDASLKISNVRVSDEGKYRCRVDSTSFKSDKTIKLSVEVVGSEPVITGKYESGKFSLLCESKGWRPEPELQWRNSKGVNLTAETETQRVADLFNVESRITVEKIDSFYCTVTQRHHEKEGRIDAHTLNERESSEARKIAVGIAVGITICVLLLVAGVIFYFCKETRKKEEINKVKSLLNSDKDSRLQHDLSQRQWDYVEETLLKCEEELKEFNLRKFDPSDRGVEKLKKVIASSKKALLKQCNLTEKSCEVLASVLSSENSLRELDLSLNKLQDSGVKKLCEGLKNSHCKLQILRLEDCDLTEGSCKDLVSVLQSENSKLIELNLSKNPGLNSGMHILCDGLKNENCKLQKLRLEDCDLTEKSCEDLAEVLQSGNSKLTELNLSKNRGLRDLGVIYLCNGLKREKCELQILRLEDCDLTEESCADLAEVLQSENSKLTELNLSQNPRLRYLGVENLRYGLKNKNCKLQILRLEDCDLTERNCKDLAEVFKSEISNLIELNLSKNPGLNSGVMYLCDGLKNGKCKLQKLRLEDCDLTEGSCADLAEVLKSEKSELIELHLSKNRRLRDSGVMYLCTGLKNKNCNLQILRLAECRITVKGFTDLASDLIENPSSPLEELDLSRNGLEESEAALKLLPKLKDTFPNLKVKLDKCSVKNESCAAPASENPSSEQDLSGNGIRESEQKLLPELKDTLPNLNVKLDECSVIFEVSAAPASENQDLSGNDQKESEKLLPDDDTFV